MDIGSITAILADQFTHVTILSTFVKLLLAMLLGGIIGIERGVHNRPAGFRTHILVCVGSCLTMITNQFVFETITELTDPTRLGAQVITGVGFLGVGTILVTGKYKIKGLTTAAGLWASACMGLAVGIGFYSGAIITGAIIFISLLAFSGLEGFFNRKFRQMEIYIEIETLKQMKEIKAKLSEQNIVITDKHFNPSSSISGEVGVHFTITIPKSMTYESTIEFIGDLDGILLVEEL